MADGALRGRAFSAALADTIDAALVEVFEELNTRNGVALVALGSYGRREVCPGSDVDVLLLHSLRGRKSADTVRRMTESLWYPLWDAGFVTGHGARTVKESVALADEDLDALTALLQVRHVAGDRQLTAELERKVRELASRRRERTLVALADASEARRTRPGPVAEMLEPDLKDGAGGLRDLDALSWAGWAFGTPGGIDTLVARGYLAPDDVDRVTRGRELLLDARVALHRTTGSRSDRLALQEQDAVAVALGYADADVFVRELASVARDMAWIAGDVWSRVRDGLAGPKGRGGGGEEAVAIGVTVRDGRVWVDAAPDGTLPASRVLDAAAEAAERGLPFERASLTGLRRMDPPTWDVWQRAAFLRLLRAGRRAVPVFEALDHEGVLTLLLPEWEHVRSLPQRNAYHRFTVDRHLLEAVAECAQLLDDGDTSTDPHDIDATVARVCRRPELLLLGALLHDIAKGRPGDHSEVGAETAKEIARRIALDTEGREILVWIVRNHLLMADVATRRDLADASVAEGIAAAAAGDAERLRLLYLLTIGDSRATGPAAWSPAKAALVRDLFIKAAAAIDRGETRALAADRRQVVVEKLGEARANAFLARLPEPYVLAFEPPEILRHEQLLAEAPVVRCERDNGNVTVTVVARDRPRLLATLAGALTVCGLDVLEANLFGTTDGLALDVFRAADPFGRLDGNGERVQKIIEDALEGNLDLDARVDERRKAYAVDTTTPGPVRIEVDTGASDTDTVVEVHVDDDIGLLFRLASALADLGLDVRVAKAATLGARVVDVFYVRDADGRKVEDEAAVRRLRAAISSCVSN